MIVVVMGVSGSGKTLVGSLLANQMSCTFYDADDYHPLENKRKMSQGIPLNDQDRQPWLCKLHTLITREKTNGQHVVLACSALKKVYRTILATGKNPLIDNACGEEKEDHSSDILFVHLHGSVEIISKRLQERKGHFMPLSLIQSQFDTLEPPTEPEVYITVDIDQDISKILLEILKKIQNKDQSCCI
uniref:Gluconokinase n=1 Tax=Leptobrachium leishanense TaxID=445787 RepID=A0A8C5M5W4_9ANUR